MSDRKPCERLTPESKLCENERCEKKLRKGDCVLDPLTGQVVNTRKAEKEKGAKGVCDDELCDNKVEQLGNVALNMEALEGILNNLTGLCQQPKCQAKYDDDYPCEPKTCPGKDPLKKSQRDFPGFSPAYAKIAKELQELKDLASQGLCRSPTCYNAYMGYYQSTYSPDCGSQTCCSAAKNGKGCGGMFCPFKRGFKKNLEEGTCGGSPCPIADIDPPQVSICGRDSCPFLPKTICGNESCPYALDDSVEQDSCDDSTCGVPKEPDFCGGPKCPFGRPNTPVGKNKCPYGGVPVCPYGGTVRTHKFTEDKGYVGEAARPYCGSASPYDYMGSLDKNYANSSAQNYSLFAYTTPPAQPPCPYLNKKNKPDCGKPSCMSRGAKQTDDFCVMKTCPWKNPPLYDDYDDEEDGICGGPKTYSCTNMDVAYCSRPVCPVDGTTRQPKPSTEIGICGGPENYSCGQPNVEYCDSPVCPLEKEKDKCKDATCPYLKKLAFCDDCGGALPDKEIEDYEIENGKTDSHGSEEASERTSTKSEENAAATAVAYNADARKLTSKDNQKIQKKKNSLIENCEDISIYSYPGIQIGHKNCNPMRPMIPGNMGWLWNSLPSFGKISRWRGYKPGAVSRGVYEIIQKHRRELGLADDDGLRKKRSKIKFKMEDLKHCVEVKKRNGDYTITVNPVKDPVQLVPFENPFIDCSPILFKVEKEKKEKKEDACPCDDEDDGKESTDSEFEFMFSPPAAIPDTNTRKKKVFKTCDTQYDPKDVGGGGKGKGKGKKKGKGKGKKGKGKTKKKIKITLITI